MVESPVADIQGYRRLAIRYGRPAKHFCGFLTLGRRPHLLQKIHQMRLRLR